MFLISFFDWGANRQKGACIPSLISLVLSIMMFCFSWKVTVISEGNEMAAMTGYESYGIALFWFILIVISFLLSIVIILESPKELNVR